MILVSDERLLQQLKQAIDAKKRNIEGAKQNTINLENQLHGMQTLYNEVCRVVEEQKDKENPPKRKGEQLGLPVGHTVSSTTVR